MKYWKPEGAGRYRLGDWVITKDWSSTKWDVYRADKLMAANCDDAVEAMKQAERMGA